MQYNSKIYKIISAFLLIVFSIIILGPFIIAFTTSLKDEGFGNYMKFFNRYNVVPYFMNSVIISIISVAIILALSLLAAFCFSKLRFRFRNMLFLFVLCALMLPPATVLMPVYRIISDLGMINTRFSLVLPYIALTAPIILLMLKSQMDEIPDVLMEAARIDGCRDFRFFVSIAVPLCKSSVVVSIIWAFLNSWNEYLFATVLLQKPEYQTIALFPAYFQGDKINLNEATLFAAYIVCMLPILLLYVVLHKQIEKGFIASGAVKG